MIVQAQNKFQSFRDLDGNPLDNGYIYIGTAGFNPETNAIQVYSDSAFTVPVAQPLRTIGGYVVINGSPVNAYTNGDYSITVRNSDGSLVYSSLSGNIDPTQESAIQVITDTQVIIDAAVASIDASVASIAAQDTQITANTNAIALITSGTYTPTILSSTNIDTITPKTFFYQKIGNIVIVHGSVAINTTATGTTTATLSLPVPSLFSTTDDAVGSVFANGNEIGPVNAETTLDGAKLFGTSTDAVNTYSWRLYFSYLVQ